MPKFIHPYTDTDTLGYENEENSLTDDTFANDCDISRIVSRFTQTGIVPPTPPRGEFVDVSYLQDLLDGRETQDGLIEQMYLSLPDEMQERLSIDDFFELVRDAPSGEAVEAALQELSPQSTAEATEAHSEGKEAEVADNVRSRG